MMEPIFTGHSDAPLKHGTHIVLLMEKTTGSVARRWFQLMSSVEKW